MSGSAVDGGRTAAPGQDADGRNVGKLPWIVDKDLGIRDANGFVIAKPNLNLTEEECEQMADFIAGAANATAGGPCNPAKLRVALEKMATWANEDGCECCVAQREQMAKRALEDAAYHCGDCARFGSDCSAGDVDGNEDCVACERFVRRERRKELRAALLRGVDMARKGCRRMGIEWVEREQLGSVEKLREALEKIAAWGPDPFIEPVNGDSSAIYENARSDENGKFLGREIPAWWGVAWRNDLKEFVALAKAALAATPRNCDRGREAAEDAFTARFGRPWTEEEARVAEWLFEEAGRTGTPRQNADGRAP